jgi:hypothetical protein
MRKEAIIIIYLVFVTLQEFTKQSIALCHPMKQSIALYHPISGKNSPESFLVVNCGSISVIYMRFPIKY